MPETTKDIISRLQKDVLQWEGYKSSACMAKEVVGLGAIEAAFPNGIFPTGAIHEFLSLTPEQAAASGSFIGGILAKLMKEHAACLWISTRRTIFPPALNDFGVQPDKIIFVDVRREKDALWVMEEGLKCKGLGSVIAEVGEFTFMQSRRLQLAVEESKVTGFVLRNDLRKLTTTACVARWQINPVPSVLEEGMPGVGHPRWQVELLRVRNGKPGSWKVEWSAGGFSLISDRTIKFKISKQIQKAG